MRPRLVLRRRDLELGARRFDLGIVAVEPGGVADVGVRRVAGVGLGDAGDRVADRAGSRIADDDVALRHDPEHVLLLVCRLFRLRRGSGLRMRPHRLVLVLDVADDVDVASRVDRALSRHVALDDHVTVDDDRSVDPDRIGRGADQEQRALVAEGFVARRTRARVMRVDDAGRSSLALSRRVGVARLRIGQGALVVPRELDVRIELGYERHLHRIRIFVDDRLAVRGLRARCHRDAVGGELRIGDVAVHGRGIVGAHLVEVADVVTGARSRLLTVIGLVVDRGRGQRGHASRGADLAVRGRVDEAVHHRTALQTDVAVGAELAVDGEVAGHPAVVVHEIGVVEHAGLSRAEEDPLLNRRAHRQSRPLPDRGRGDRDHGDGRILRMVDRLADPHPHLVLLLHQRVVVLPERHLQGHRVGLPGEYRHRIRGPDRAVVGADRVEPVVRRGLVRRDADGREVVGDVVVEAVLDIDLRLLDRALGDQPAAVLREKRAALAHGPADIADDRRDDDRRRAHEDQREHQRDAGTEMSSLSHGTRSPDSSPAPCRRSG